MNDHDDPRAEEALLSREQGMREEGRWTDRYRTRVREPVDWNRQPDAMLRAHAVSTLASPDPDPTSDEIRLECDELVSGFPKVCGACGTAYRDAAEWRALSFVGMQPDPGNPDLELRLCTCGSTIAMPRVSS